TAAGLQLGKRIAASMPETVLFVSRSAAADQAGDLPVRHFSSLARAVAEQFPAFSGHVFVMSTGIAVRVIAPWIRSKTTDPAVVVLDDLGLNCISLLSGHLGGANALTERISRISGASPIISTATDIRGLPAIDSLAGAKGLLIENPAQIKRVNTAILAGQEIRIHDPYALLLPDLRKAGLSIVAAKDDPDPLIAVDDRLIPVPEETLVLRPRSLAAGIGCNRGTGREEILGVLTRVCQDSRLARTSLACLASIDLKNDEPGLLAAAGELGLDILFASKSELSEVTGVKTPSKKVEQWIGVASVCEAAAILAAGQGSLVVSKQARGNVTVALARRARPFI
ncbi:MAG: cobalamin biosynthesis protein, partial [Desulfohalobiaceae bacterium]|nr:cobalamin biosynthesis protein [Desulfohalobiaceae bacterium]